MEYLHILTGIDWHIIGPILTFFAILAAISSNGPARSSDARICTCGEILPAWGYGDDRLHGPTTYDSVRIYATERDALAFIAGRETLHAIYSESRTPGQWASGEIVLRIACTVEECAE